MIARKLFVVCPSCRREVSVDSLNDKTTEIFGGDITPLDVNDEESANCSYVCPLCGEESDGAEFNVIGRYLCFPR